MRHRIAGGLWFLPGLPCGDRRDERLPGVLHHPGGRTVVRTQTGAAGLRRNVMELYISDHPLDCAHLSHQRRLRTAGYRR